MNLKSLMTTDVLSVRPETPLKEVARLLARYGISGLPVVEANGVVVGVVSEGDILFKESGAGDHVPLPWRLAPRKTALQAKASARTAADAMSSPAVTVEGWRSVAAAARLMLEQKVNRLPVVEHDRLVGIVTRADLVRAFARSDAAVAADVRDAVRRALLLPDFARVDVSVAEGEVHLAGSVDSRLDARLAAEVAAAVPGVVAVSSELEWRMAEVGA
jgi:CBS domain-containing protein